MLQFSTPAILIRRTEYGDYDLIVTFFSLTLGKVSLMAKAAKKSTRRFAGLLELFTELDIVGSVGRKSGLPVLQEATLRHPHPEIREAPTKTAYASYWSGARQRLDGGACRKRRAVFAAAARARRPGGERPACGRP